MKRALLVIDVQNEYVDGKLPIAFPDPSVSLANIQACIDSARTAGIPIIVVEAVLPENAPAFAKGSHGAALVPGIAERARDLLLSKPLPSCLARTELEPWLRVRGIDTLTLVGYMTHNCVDATARDASQRGFSVEVVSDATGSPGYANPAGKATAEELHRVSLTVLQARFASVMTTREWTALLPSRSAPPSTGILASFSPR